MMRFYRMSSWLLIMVFLFSACSQSTGSPPVTPPAKPQTDKTTIIGRVLDKKTGQPLDNRVLRLGEVKYKVGGGEDEGIYIMDASLSPGTRSDSNGYFIFENIEAREYVILLEIVVDAFYSVAKGDDNNPLSWHPEAGKVLDLGSVYINQDEPE